MRSRNAAHAQPVSGPAPEAPDLLDEWVGAGLIAPEQAERIRAHEAARHDRRPRLAAAPAVAPVGPSLVVEALGYLGGVIMLVGAGILVGLYWGDLPVVLRLLLVGVTAAALVGAGFAVPDRLGEAADRLRAVLWALAVAATVGFFTVLTADVLDVYDEDSLLVIGPGTAVVAATLWSLRRTWLQQAGLLVALVLSAIGVTGQVTGMDSSWPGAVVAAVGVTCAVLAWAGRFAPRESGVSFGVVVAVAGSMGIDNDAGILLALLVAVAMVALALGERSLPWLGIAALATLWTAPRAAVAWFPGRLSASLTLIVTGGLLVGAAVWVARHQGGVSSRR
jgi:hypothetical protein